jgi:hypothetical protein
MSNIGNKKVNEIIESFRYLVITKFKHYYNTWGDTHVATISIRPNIGFEDPVVEASEYNKQNNLIREIRKEKEEKEKIKKQKKKHTSTMYGTNIKKTINDTSIDIICLNKYKELSNLEEKCMIYNAHTDSHLTPTVCVEKVTSIKGRKYVQNIDLDHCVRVCLNKEEVEKTKISKGVNTNEDPLYENTKNFFIKLEMLISKLELKQSDESVANHKKTCGKIKKVTDKVDHFNKIVDKDITKIINVTNPDKESKACMFMGEMIPEPCSRLLKDLIGKAAYACIELNKFKRSLIKNMNDISKEIHKLFIDLD